ncbi:hypothetical protein ACFYYN_41590 [Streptomyces sp. NPDC001902]
MFTQFGALQVERIAYRTKGASNLYPGDTELDLPTRRRSHTLKRLAALEAARGSFADVQTAIGRATRTRNGKRQAIELVQRAARDIDDFYTSARSASGCGCEEMPGRLGYSGWVTVRAHRMFSSDASTPTEKDPDPTTPASIVTEPTAGLPTGQSTGNSATCSPCQCIVTATLPAPSQATVSTVGSPSHAPPDTIPPSPRHSSTHTRPSGPGRGRSPPAATDVATASAPVMPAAPAATAIAGPAPATTKAASTAATTALLVLFTPAPP